MDLKSTLSVKFTPAEIKNRKFKTSAFGYSPKAVREFLDLVAKAWEKMQAQEKELGEKTQRLTDEVARWRAKEAELEKLREKTMAEGQAIREQAQADAEKKFAEIEERANQIRRKTEEWLEEVIAEVEETQRQKMSFMTAFKSALDSHYALLQRQPADNEPIGARLNHLLKDSAAGQGESKH
jgi:cell division initiation protein